MAQEDVSKTLSDTQRVLWPLADNLGTVRDLAKQDGTIAVHYKFDAYGNVTSGDTSVTRYLFTGREFDADTELQYNRARWYDPEVGRWISEDPIGFAAGDANVHRYVGNGPTNATDPSGLQRASDEVPEGWKLIPTRPPLDYVDPKDLVLPPLTVVKNWVKDNPDVIFELITVSILERPDLHEKGNDFIDDMTDYIDELKRPWEERLETMWEKEPALVIGAGAAAAAIGWGVIDHYVLPFINETLNPCLEDEFGATIDTISIPFPAIRLEIPVFPFGLGLGVWITPKLEIRTIDGEFVNPWVDVKLLY